MELGKDWAMVGVIPLFDPPRDDTAETIKRANALGISVKMITGDQVQLSLSLLSCRSCSLVLVANT